MTSLPPLPITLDSKGEECLLLDNSGLEHYLNCGRKFEYSFIRKRTSLRSAPPLNFGSCIHQTLKHRFLTYGLEDPTTCTLFELQQIESYFEANPQPFGEYRNSDLAKQLTEQYNKTYKNEPFKIVEREGKRLVEVSFTHYLGDVWRPDKPLHIYLMGRIDLVIEDAMGVWIVDHKTAFMFGRKFWDAQRMSFQCKGYVWAYMQSYGEKPIGYAIDALRTYKASKTDEFKPAEVRKDDLGRDFFPVTDEMIDEWKLNFLAHAQDIVNKHYQGFYPRNPTSCVGKYGACPFIEVCANPEEQRLPLLMSGEFVDNNWSPLNKPSPQEEE